MNILITGGCGYIGYYLVRKLVKNKHKVFVVDNLVNGKKKFHSNLIKYYNFSFDNIKTVNLIKEKKITDIYHLAAYIDAEESIFKPKKYFINNVIKLDKFLRLLKLHNNKKIRFYFASSAAVYGLSKKIKINEDDKCKPVSPYGKSKLLGEKLIIKYASKNLQYIIFRFFNVAGADHKLNHGPENRNYKHLLNKIKDVSEKFIINGSNYKTRDKTCVRDFVHIKDLVTILTKSSLLIKKNKNNLILNLCTGYGASVKHIVDTYKRLSRKKFEIIYGPRRKGDPSSLIGDNKRINKLIKYNYKNIETIIRDIIKWKR